MPRLALLAASLLLAGCGARDCLLDIARRDCSAERSGPTTFPQDDASCRSYGLTPGTRDYALCRSRKAHEQSLSAQESDYSFLRNPSLPDLH